VDPCAFNDKDYKRLPFSGKQRRGSGRRSACRTAAACDTAGGYLRAVDHYAEAFAVAPGRCWRLVEDDNGTTRPSHCHVPVVWRGTYRTAEGEVFKVASCDGHADGLTDARRARSAG